MARDNDSKRAAAVLAESLAEHDAYWSSHVKLRPEQKRWKAFELELRTNMAAKGEKPADWFIAEIRSGQWEKRQQRILRNMQRDRARLAWLRREGYTFDEEHRLVAPQLSNGVAHFAQRGVSRERRPQVHRVARSVASCGSPRRSNEDDPEPPPLAPRLLCERAGCGITFAPKGKKRYHDDACADLARQHKRRAKIRAARPVNAELIVCPGCGEFVSRLVERTGWCDSCTRDAAIAKVPTRIPVREATRPVKSTRRFEVSLIPLELGFDARPMNGRLHWPSSIPMREVIIETVDDPAFPHRALERLMEGADTDDRYWNRVSA